MSEARRSGQQEGTPAAAPKPAPPTRPIPLPVVASREDGGAGTRAGRSTTDDAANRRSAASENVVSGERAASRGLGKPRRRRRRRGKPRLPERAIVFVGPMAAGKTSLGRRVAKELGIPFVDSDALFVRAHGPVTDFFAAKGEAEFRRIEAEIIATALSEPGTKVLALGGGAVLTDSTRELLREHPTVLLLTTQRAVLRTANLSRRPLLRDDPNAWGRILAERKHLYLEVADVTFRTDRATKEQLTQRVVQWARAYARREHGRKTQAGTQREKTEDRAQDVAGE